ncbi:hypothetical protein V5O48_006167 [Marasmius crinis-equi]|uniref:Phosphatases II n=1 Tax=Marasmius crinis-equi TaxID=585013 RepID=A0ABR3FKA9_9AGAR
MSRPNDLPEWLTASQNSSHVQLALKTLKAREDTRTRASYASMPHMTGALRTLLQNIPKSTADFYAVTAGHDEHNQHRNRYSDVVPYDRTRVVVKENAGCCAASSDSTDGEYLNADWVLERFGGKWWIASQAPLPNTSHTFLSLISKPISPPSPSDSGSALKSRVRTVVQLTQNLEEGRRKAHPYFPDTVGQSMIIRPEAEDMGPPFKVTLLQQEDIADARCVRSTVSFTPLSSASSPSTREADSTPITFRHLLYHAWPDRGVPEPEDRAGLLAFARLVDETNRQQLSESEPTTDLDPDPPIIVGCSAGIGRTGSFIALSSLLRSHGVLQPPGTRVPASTLPPSPLGELPDALKDDEVAREVDSLREQRPGMVQRPEQLIVIYEILAAALNSQR